MEDIIEKMHLKYQANVPHATHVADLARHLFADLQDVHGLDETDLPLLVRAAYLHDIGYFIHDKKHHRHSFHIIQHDRLLDAWDPKERARVALLALNHRKKDKLLKFEDVPEKWRHRLLSLTALLRIADVLDYEHDQQAQIEEVQIDQANGRVTLLICGMLLLQNQEQIRQKTALAERVWNMEFHLQNV